MRSIREMLAPFGAQPELCIGELWARGRAWANGLSKANYTTNFCSRWSGGKNFMNHGEAGFEERLTDIRYSLKGHPAFAAINAGCPPRTVMNT